MSANPLELFSASYLSSGKPLSVDLEVFRPERRKRVRTKLHWPILLFRDHATDALESVTQDLSSTGFYCLSRFPFACGETLICSLKVPTHDPAGKERTLPLECRVRVVRSEAASAQGFFGIACQIEDYRLVTVAHDAA